MKNYIDRIIKECLLKENEILDIFHKIKELKHNSDNNILNISQGKIFNKRGSYINIKNKEFIKDAKSILKYNDPFTNKSDILKLIEIGNKYSESKDWIYDDNKLNLLWAGSKAQEKEYAEFIKRTLYDTIIGTLLEAKSNALLSKENPEKYNIPNELIFDLNIDNNGKINIK